MYEWRIEGGEKERRGGESKEGRRIMGGGS